MGEKKRREATMTPYEKAILEMTRKFADDGKLIEVGWLTLRKAWCSEETPPAQVAALRFAFLAGAQHLFGSILQILDQGSEPTEKDLSRMDLIAKELTAVETELRQIFRLDTGRTVN